ncbi:MAG: class I SAM-dependent methyltransferase [Pseudomonadota bacterium]
MRQPFVAAALAARYIPRGRPILDAACGTGLAGEMLSVLGYDQLIGCDISSNMRDIAGKLGVYRQLIEADLAALPFPDHTFAGFVCCGAFGPGHAPPEALEELVRVCEPGAVGVFTLREDTFRDQGFPVVMAALTERRQWHILEETRPARTYLLAEPKLFTRYFAVEITG